MKDRCSKMAGRSALLKSGSGFAKRSDDVAAESSEDEEINEEDGGASESNSEEEELQQQVADVPFEILQQARSDGRPSVFSRSWKVETKRANKNRPMEVTSKKPVTRHREVIQAPKKVIRDPRFESLSGNFDEKRFKQSYSFLYDEELPVERQRLQKLIQSKKGAEDMKQLKENLAWIDRQLKEEAVRREQTSRQAEMRKKEKEAVKKGKRPYYPKKSELRNQKLVEKFKTLKETGKLEAHLAKRRKKNAAKDHRYMPYRRAQES